MCNDASVEDEFHFVMICSIYSPLRNKFFNEINAFIVNFANLTKWDQFLFLMNSDDIEVLSLILTFSDKCLKILQFCCKFYMKIQSSLSLFVFL